MEDKTSNLNFKVYIEDSICHFEFVNELTVAEIMASESHAMNLMNESKVDILPFVIDLSKVEDAGVKIEVGDFGKIISSRTLFDRCSGVCIVGAKGNIKTLATLLNKTFLGDRIQFFDNLEEAKTAAKALVDIKIPMLEQDIT